MPPYPETPGYSRHLENALSILTKPPNGHRAPLLPAWHPKSKLREAYRQRIVRAVADTHVYAESLAGQPSLEAVRHELRQLIATRETCQIPEALRILQLGDAIEDRLQRALDEDKTSSGLTVRELRDRLERAAGSDADLLITLLQIRSAASIALLNCPAGGRYRGEVAELLLSQLAEIWRGLHGHYPVQRRARFDRHHYGDFQDFAVSVALHAGLDRQVSVARIRSFLQRLNQEKILSAT